MTFLLNLLLALALVAGMYIAGIASGEAEKRWGFEPSAVFPIFAFCAFMGILGLVVGAGWFTWGGV